MFCGELKMAPPPADGALGSRLPITFLPQPCGERWSGDWPWVRMWVWMAVWLSLANLLLYQPFSGRSTDARDSRRWGPAQWNQLERSLGSQVWLDRKACWDPDHAGLGWVENWILSKTVGWLNEMFPHVVRVLSNSVSSLWLLYVVFFKWATGEIFAVDYLCFLLSHWC